MLSSVELLDVLMRNFPGRVGRGTWTPGTLFENALHALRDPGNRKGNSETLVSKKNSLLGAVSATNFFLKIYLIFGLRTESRSVSMSKTDPYFKDTMSKLNFFVMVKKSE